MVLIYHITWHHILEENYLINAVKTKNPVLSLHLWQLAFNARFEVHTAASIAAVFEDATQCHLIEPYWNFRQICRLHQQGRSGWKAACFYKTTLYHNLEDRNLLSVFSFYQL